MVHSSILKALQRDDAVSAEALCNKAILSAATDDTLWHWRGLARLKSGDLDSALDDLRRAIELNPDAAHYHSNLAEALRRSGDFESAAAAARRALAINPGYQSAQLNLGICLLKLDQSAEALAVFNQIKCTDADADAEVMALKADAERQRQRPIQAIALYRKALALRPDYVHAHTNLGPLLIEQGQWEAALEHCRKAVALAPAQALSHINLGRCLVLLDQLEEAMEAYSKAHELAPDAPLLNVNIAQVWLEAGDLAETELWLDRALSLDADDFKALTTLARVWIQDERIGEALELLRQLQIKAPEDFGVQSALGDACWDDGDIDGALMHLGRASEIRPQLAVVHASIGRVLASVGQMDGAHASYGQALELNPRCVPALSGLASSQRGALDVQWVKQLQGLLDSSSLRDGALGSVHGSLGFYFDGKKQYDRAAEHIEQSNRLQWAHKSKRGWNYRPEHYRHLVDQTIRRYDRDLILDRMAAGHDSDLPVFVVGMPRSGTTLTEQVLSSHPDVAGVGERHFATRSLGHLPIVMQSEKSLDQCVRSASASDMQKCGDWHLQQLQGAVNGRDVARIVDKMPDNYNHLGWIMSVFPQARIIYARRDPRDIAVSCWMTNFSQIQWACQQSHIAERLIEHHRLMQHWLQIMPERILVQDYEDLVDDPETHIRRLVDWMGLDWHPDCLQFHKSKDVVRTASVTQVRQPIYKRSVNRWQAYEQALAPLFDRLQQQGLIADQSG